MVKRTGPLVLYSPAEVLIWELRWLKPRVKHARMKAVLLADMIASMKIPTQRDFVKEHFEAMLERFNGPRSQPWTKAEQASFRRAHEALALQDVMDF